MRKAYLGMFESGALAGSSSMRREIVNLLREVTAKHNLPAPVETLPVSRMIYIAAYQGGIERILELPSNQYLNRESDSAFLRRQGQPSAPCMEVLNLAIEVASWAGSGDENKTREARKILLFVHDIIVAMANNTAVINASGIPTKASVIQSLPADIAMPICNLLSGLSTINEPLPAPRVSIEKNAVSRLEKLMLSGAFSHYAAAHSDVGDISPSKDLSYVVALGNKLIDAGGDLLCRRRASLTLLPIIPKIIDVAFGKLPSLFAQAAGDLAMQYANQRKNVMIYRFEDCINEYRKASFLGLLDGLTTDARNEFAEALFRLRAARKANIKIQKTGA